MKYVNVIRDILNAPVTRELLSDQNAQGKGIPKRESSLTEGQIQEVESILRSGTVGYAYLYPHGKEIPEVFVFSQTPENIANFIGQHGAQSSEMTLTDRLDMTVLTTFGGYIDKCRDPQLLRSVLQYLVPIQMGQEPPEPVPAVPVGTMELYCEMLEAAQTGMRMGFHRSKVLQASGKTDGQSRRKPSRKQRQAARKYCDRPSCLQEQ